MTNDIIRILKAMNVPAWIVCESTRESAELFFIRKTEDMRREKSVREISVTVYRDFEENNAPMRGFSSVILQPGMSETEMEVKLKNAWQSAQYVRNPFFELPDSVSDAKEDTGALAELSPMENAEIMADALFTPDRDDVAFINSAEIFSERTKKHILTSRGTDVSFAFSSVKGEFVAQCVSPADVEMYFDFQYDSPDTLAISALSAEALNTVRDRAEAHEAAPVGSYNLILTKKHVCEVLSSYVSNADASFVYAKYSSYAVGCNVQGDDVKNEKLNISVYSQEPYSEDGITMPERKLVENGRLLALHGATRFCRYLGMEPVGSYRSMRVQNGSMSLEDMKKKPYLMPVAFSDFQMDPFSKRFGGEIRLAYLFDGDTVRLVTGGSVSGSLLEKQDSLVFSYERYTDSNYDGPYALRISDVRVAGI